MPDFPCTLITVTDGDTVKVDADLGINGIHMHVAVRLFGIDTPELRTPEGKLARDAVYTWLAEARIALATLVLSIPAPHKADKYGRTLGTIWRGEPRTDPNWRPMSLNDWLLIGGYARRYDGGTK